MNWMDELADETFDMAFKAAMKEMRNEFRKNKIKRIFEIDVYSSDDGTLG
jgi:hypothetical protein